MIRYVFLVISAMVGGCDNGYAPSFSQSCVVTNDCENKDPCTVPRCVSNECLYTDVIDGSSCETVDAYHGVCDSGSCIGFTDAPLLNIPPSKCELDSDCFVQQCTNSICNYGYCFHVAYEDGASCFGGPGLEPFFGTCKDGACK